jgi:hypothetical protein
LRKQGLVFWRCTLYQLLEEARCCFLKVYSILITWERTMLFPEGVLYICYLEKHGAPFSKVYSISVTWGSTMLFPEEVFYISYLRKYGARFVKVYSVLVSRGSTVVVSWRCTQYQLLGEARCSFRDGVFYISYLRKHGGCFREVYSLSFTWRSSVIVFWRYSLCVFLEEGRRCTLCCLLDEGLWLSTVDIIYVCSLRKIGGCLLEVFSMSVSFRF